MWCILIAVYADKFSEKGDAYKRQSAEISVLSYRFRLLFLNVKHYTWVYTPNLGCVCRKIPSGGDYSLGVNGYAVDCLPQVAVFRWIGV